MSTKADALDKFVRSGKAATKEQQILEFMAGRPGRAFTRNELAEWIPMRLSTVCGAVNKLVRVGDLRTVGRRACTITGESVNEVRLRELF